MYKKNFFIGVSLIAICICLNVNAANAQDACSDELIQAADDQAALDGECYDLGGHVSPESLGNVPDEMCGSLPKSRQCVCYKKIVPNVLSVANALVKFGIGNWSQDSIAALKETLPKSKDIRDICKAGEGENKPGDKQPGEKKPSPTPTASPSVSPTPSDGDGGEDGDNKDPDSPPPAPPTPSATPGSDLKNLIGQLKQDVVSQCCKKPEYGGCIKGLLDLPKYQSIFVVNPRDKVRDEFLKFRIDPKCEGIS